MYQITGLLLLVIIEAHLVATEVPEGTANSCKKQVNEQEQRSVCNQVPSTVNNETDWCFFSVFNFSLCITTRTEYRTECQYELVTVTKTVWECCSGYGEHESDDTCIPLCKPECVHGTCEQPNECSCEEGYRGQSCENQCQEGFYGDCTQQCDCKNGGSCDPEDGNCHCEPGFVGDKCQNLCEPWKHGTGCILDCLCNREHTDSCNNRNGQCTCKSGYQDAICATRCDQGSTGSGCTLECPCQNGGHCIPEDTGCSCTAGWFGAVCADPCPSNLLWGDNCAYACPICFNGGQCDRFSGSCKCEPGFIGKFCEEECEVGFWGNGCSNVCDCAFNVPCDSKNGTCLCNEFQSGSTCEVLDCPENLFGPNCLHSCACQNNATCDDVNGLCDCAGTGYEGTHCNYAVCDPQCVNGICDRPNKCACEPGFWGDACESECEHGKYGMDCALTCDCTSELPFCDHIEGCITPERYHELYPPEPQRNIDSHSDTSSVDVTWVEVGIPVFVSFVLVLALMAAFYFRAEAKNGKPRKSPPGYPDRNSFINPTFSRSHQNFTNQDGMVIIASNGGASYTAPYEQPPQYEDILYEDKVPQNQHQQQQKQAETPEELNLDHYVNSPTAVPQGELPKEQKTLSHIYEHIEEKEENESTGDPSKTQLTVDNEHTYLDGNNPERKEVTKDSDAPTHPEKMNQFVPEAFMNHRRL